MDATLSLYDRAAAIPGRSLTRSKKVFERFAQGADGAIVRDTEDRDYIDMLCGLGAISLGYQFGKTFMRHKAAVYSLPHEWEIEAAEAVIGHIAPWASWVRFTKTGSEATHAAYRIAKAATGRNIVLRCVGSYHGWHEWCDVAPGELFYGDSMEVWKGYADWSQVAAIIIEPRRFEPTNAQWLLDVRCWCDDVGALLIFDSMIYGGRFALGGASQYFGIEPDLECFGKAYGNGAAVSFVVGKDNTYQHGEIASGTFSGELSGLSAVIDTLGVYTTDPVIETMWARGHQLMGGLKAVIPAEFATVKGFPVCMHLDYVNKDIDQTYNLPADGVKFCHAMRDRGVLMHPVPILTMYAHTPAQIETVIHAAGEAAREVLSGR